MQRPTRSFPLRFGWYHPRGDSRGNSEIPRLGLIARSVLAASGGGDYFKPMSSVKEIESAVARLSREELASFRSWFADFDAEAWDRQFEADAAAGRLDALGEE